MKKRIYYIIYAIIQIVGGFYGFLTAFDIASKEFDSVSQISKELASLYSVEMLTNCYKFLMIVSIIIGLYFLIYVLKNKKLVKNGLTIGLLIVSIFSSLDIVALLAIITLIVVISTNDKVTTEKKAKKEPVVVEMSNPKTTKNDYISAIVLIIAYFGQLLVVPLLSKIIGEAFATILYDLMLIFVAIWAFFGRYKRDFKYLKENLSYYIKKAFKYWGIMLLAVSIASGVKAVLGVTDQTANQAALETLPFWYLIPSALIFAPIVEEAIFRGSIRRFIKNDVVFIIVSALTFGLLHTFLSEEGLYNIIVQSLNYAAMGGVLAYSYTKTNNIYTSMMAHFLQNSFGVIMMILQVL